MSIPPLAPSPLAPGFKLDRYELLCPIAEGGMASIWIARQTGKHGFRKLVAIKTILPKYAAEPKFQQMFIDEARIASRIEHPNVTQILDVGEQHDIAYLVMEYVDGDALSKVNRAAQKKNKPIPPGVLLRIMADTCAGLHAAHELKDEAGVPLGVIHRDVSPQNVLVTTKGTSKLIDFGIAKARDRLSGDTQTDQVKGKIAYMAPEQALGRSMDRRADLWSVGAVLYHLLVGKTPYEGENEVQALFAMSSGRPPAPLPASVPAPISEIVRRSLSLKPDARYGTAAEVQEALEKAMVEASVITTAAQVAAFMADLMGDRAEKRKQSIALGLKAADEREKLAEVLQRNAETPGVESDSGAGTPSAAGGRVVTAAGSGSAPTPAGSGSAPAPGGSGSAPESQKSVGGTTGQTLGGSAAMAVPTIDSEPASKARPERRKAVVVVAGIAVVAAAATVAVVASRKPEPPNAAVGDQLPSASAPAASTITTPSASASSATKVVDAAPSAAAAAASQPAARPPVRWAPAPKPTSNSKQRDYGF